MEQQECSSPHVFLLPHPLQGHLKPMLNLAEIFCLNNIKVTFLSSTHVHQRLTRYTDFEARFGRYPGFRFMTLSDGLPDDHPRSGHHGARDVAQGFMSNLEPIFKEMLTGLGNTTPVTCLIVDGWLNFAHHVAKEANIPVIIFRTFSACCVWIYFCVPELIKAQEMPFQAEDMDRLLKNVPGMGTFLRCRDLPFIFRDNDMLSCYDLQQSYVAEMLKTQTTHALILNTFDDLEGPILSLIRSRCKKVYTVGPLHSHLRYRLNPAEKSGQKSSSSSLWEVDQSCMSWLDEKPDKSVVYVSFGSLTVLSRDQLIEIWTGIVQSNRYFLWVIRPNLITDSISDCPTPDELMQGTADRGYIVGWAPQEEILGHRAVGGFLTHSGWNSTLESITAGMPMLCWPSFGDQQVNSRYMSEVCRIGLDMKDTCDRNMVAKMINELMDGKEIQEEMAKMSELAMKSVTEGGSSYCNLDNLIQDIRLMSKKNGNQVSFT